MYFDVHFHFPACKFACGVVFCNDTDGLPGKNTTKIKGVFNEKNFFDENQFFRPISYWKLCLLCAMRAFCV